MVEDPVTGFSRRGYEGQRGADLQFSAFQKTFHGLSASIGATFRVGNHISLKANIGRAYRAPNITELSSNGLDPGAHIIYRGNRHFNPEFSLQEDLGILAKFKDVSFEASMFNNNVQDFIYLTMVADEQGNPLMDPQGNRTYQYEQSKAQLYGGELWMSLHPADWSGFRWENSLSVVYGFNRDPHYKNMGIHGAYLPLMPPAKLTSAVAQSFHLTNKKLTLTPRVEVECHAAQKRYWGLNETESATPGYTLLNAGIVASFNYAGNRTLQFIFQVDNLLERDYQSHLSRLKYFEYYTDAPDGRKGIYNMGRNLVLKMVLPF